MVGCYLLTDYIGPETDSWSQSHGLSGQNSTTTTSTPTADPCRQAEQLSAASHISARGRYRKLAVSQGDRGLHIRRYGQVTVLSSHELHTVGRLCAYPVVVLVVYSQQFIGLVWEWVQ